MKSSEKLKEKKVESKIKKPKSKKNITLGCFYILATFNNTKVCFTDLSGNVISWSNAGKCGFKGSRKSTAYAAQIVTNDAGKIAITHGMKEVYIYVSGPGLGRESSIRAAQGLGLIINGIKDTTGIPHNGCRRPKKRRV